MRNHFLLLLGSVILAVLVSPQTASVSVNDARPVAFAAKMLEQQYGWIITYEDPIYVHESELADVTETVRRDLDKYKPGEAPKVIVPKGGNLAFKFYVDPATDKAADSALVVQELLDAYALTGHPGVFRLDKDGQRLHIIPMAFKDKDGVVRPQPSILDARITLPAQERNGFQLMDAFCAAVNQAGGIRLRPAAFPANMFLHYKTQSGAKDQKARDVLTHELDLIHAKLSWQLFYDPSSKSYFLNIYAI
jgi:hypothetical protein